MAMLGPVIVCLLTLGVASSNEIRSQKQQGLGHMEPLGHQRPMEGTVERVPSDVTPFQFFSRYVETATPVVLHRAISGTVPNSKWTDVYLRLVHCVLWGLVKLSCGFRVDHACISRHMLSTSAGLILAITR